MTLSSSDARILTHRARRTGVVEEQRGRKPKNHIEILVSVPPGAHARAPSHCPWAHVFNPVQLSVVQAIRYVSDCMGVGMSICHL